MIYFKLCDCHICIFISLILWPIYLSFCYTFVLLGNCWFGNWLWNSSYKSKYFFTYPLYFMSMALIALIVSMNVITRVKQECHFLTLLWTFIATAFARVCSTICCLHFWAVAIASLCWLPDLSCRKPRKLLGCGGKPHKKGKVRYVNKRVNWCYKAPAMAGSREGPDSLWVSCR